MFLTFKKVGSNLCLCLIILEYVKSKHNKGSGCYATRVAHFKIIAYLLIVMDLFISSTAWMWKKEN